jgi:hypothetical protein
VQAQSCSSCPDSCSGGGFCPLGYSASATDWCAYPNTGCPAGQTAQGTCCCDTTPIIVDVLGDGVQLTDAYNGVRFDVGTDGRLDQVAWTRPGSDDSWLALDRNGNGLIDNGSELFGNMAPQPSGAERNGFRALAEYDKPANGGNGDGKIDVRDPIFTSLVLWNDINHNGRTDPGEMKSLEDVGIASISLDYRDSRHVDQFGNQFRYRSKLDDARRSSVGPWAWDVILLVNPRPQ